MQGDGGRGRTTENSGTNCREPLRMPGRSIWRAYVRRLCDFKQQDFVINVQVDEDTLGIQNIGIEGSARNSIVDLRQVLNFWEKLYHRGLRST